MPTTGTVTFSTGAIVGGRVIYASGADSKFDVSRSGNWPNQSYTITRAVCTYTRSQAGNVGTNILRENSPGGTMGSATNSYFTGQGTVALAKTKSLYNGLTRIGLYGDHATAGTIAAGSTITITVTWQLDEEKSTYTLSSDSVSTGGNITMTITRGEGVARHVGSITLGEQVLETETTGTSIVFSIPSSWAAEIPNGTSATAAVSLASYGTGGNLIGTSTGILTVTVAADVVPTISITVTPLETRLNGLLLEGIGKVSFTATAAGAQGSTISTYTFPTGDGGSITTTAASYTTDVLTNLPDGQSTESRTLTVTVTDSRGRTASASATVTIYAYAAPTIDTTENRSDSGGTADPEGTYIRCEISPAWQQITGNTGTLKVEYGVDSYVQAINQSISPGDQGYTIGGGNVDVRYVYSVRYTLTDAVGNSVQVVRTVPTGAVFMVWDPVQESVGFGGYPGAGGKKFFISSAWTVYIGTETLAEYIQRIAGS